MEDYVIGRRRSGLWWRSASKSLETPSFPEVSRASAAACHAAAHQRHEREDHCNGRSGTFRRMIPFAALTLQEHLQLEGGGILRFGWLGLARRKISNSTVG